MCQNAIYIYIFLYIIKFDVSKTQGVCHMIHSIFGSSLVMYKCAMFHLCRICVTDFSEGGPFCLPNSWATPKRIIQNKVKTVDITPIYKREKKELTYNYRPVGILPVLSRLYERSILKQISEFFENIFSKYQCGFT